jgi:myosin heavy subunit
MAGEILKQLRYSGMMEAIRIRREGYGLREEHESFYNRFSVLLGADEASKGSGIEHLITVLSRRLHVTEADWQVGHTKVFLRRELADKLERLAKLRVHVAARTLGRFGRRVARQRSALLLVHWARFRLHMLKRNRQTKAATRLTAAIRRFKQENVYQGFRRAVIQVQAEQRRKFAIRSARRLRDPFVDMTFRECQELLKKEKSRLDQAVARKNFRLAAELEAKM